MCHVTVTLMTFDKQSNGRRISRSNCSCNRRIITQLKMCSASRTLNLTRYDAAISKEEIFTLRASCGAVYCNRSCLWVCVCVYVFVGVCLWVCYHDNSEIACIDPHQTGSVGKGSDHHQVIKFWPSRAPGKAVCGGAKIFGSALLQPARSVCV